MRFHRVTKRFHEIQAHLESSKLAPRLITSGGHVWIALDPPLQSSSEEMVAALVTQINEITAIAFANFD
jgi:hypothetical protein